MTRKLYALLIAGLLAFVGCVVIPDTFTADIDVTIRHVQEQAEGVLDYVSGETDTLPELEPAPAPSESSWLENAVDSVSFVQVVYAQLEDNSPRVRQIAESMRQRYPRVQEVKATGAVGENNRGLLELVKPELLTDPEKRNEVQRVIAADNEDRKALYKEIARLNSDQNLSVSAVERVYAKERLERAKTGEVFQLPPPGEAFEEFKKSSLCAKLGDKCIANAWVTIP